jgi:hypothetical protein
MNRSNLSLVGRIGHSRWRVRRVAVALAAALLMCLPGAVAASAQVLVVRDEVDITVQLPFLSATCGYDVFSHLEGTTTAVVTFDDAGNPVREVDTGVLMRTFYAPETGRSVSFPLPVNLFTDYQPDGSAIAMTAGLFLSVHASGGQPLLFRAGREVYSAVLVDIRPDGVPIIELVDLLLANGADWGAITDICLALDA